MDTVKKICMLRRSLNGFNEQHGGITGDAIAATLLEKVEMFGVNSEYLF